MPQVHNNRVVVGGQARDKTCSVASAFCPTSEVNSPRTYTSGFSTVQNSPPVFGTAPIIEILVSACGQGPGGGRPVARRRRRPESAHRGPRRCPQTAPQPIVSFADVPKSVPIGHENGPRRTLRGPFPLVAGTGFEPATSGL